MSGERSGDRPSAARWWAVELYRRGKELELMHRALGFATLALVTLAPLLIVVAAADPLQHGGFALWLVDGMDLSGRSERVLSEAFSPSGKVVGTLSVWGGVLLALFGLSFASSVQNGYERVWRLPAGPWHRIWRQAVWLLALMTYLYVQVQTRTVLAGTYRMLLSLAIGVLFFWWGPHFLLGRQVRWRLLLPGAVATMAGLVGLRAFSYLVFTPLIVTNAVSYGAVGTVLIVESWFVGAGFVVHGGALVGHLFCDRTGHLLAHEDREEIDGAGRIDEIDGIVASGRAHVTRRTHGTEEHLDVASGEREEPEREEDEGKGEDEEDGPPGRHDGTGG